MVQETDLDSSLDQSSTMLQVVKPEGLLLRNRVRWTRRAGSDAMADSGHQHLVPQKSTNILVCFVSTAVLLLPVSAVWLADPDAFTMIIIMKNHTLVPSLLG